MITLFICFFISGAVFTIVSSYVLKLDVSNAIQTIGSIVLYDDEGSTSILTEKDGKLKITGSGNNFIINSGNNINSSENSSILGGSDNIINGGNASTVYGGIRNNIQSDLSIILGGSDNSIYSNSKGSVVIGHYNKVNALSDRNLENSVVIGSNNEMNGSYSSVVGNNSVVGNGEYNETYNSVAMGSGATVVGNNSFLWVDGSEEINLFNDDVFAIFSENGMAVNEAEPNSKAKFNVGSYFVIATGSSGNNIQCGSGNGTGIIKIEDRDDIVNQKCLCSCDGEEWKSIIGEGQCESICKGEKSDIFPDCVTGGIKIVQSGDKKVYSGECIGGSVIEGSYYMDGSTIWWQCQGKNGNTRGCSYKSECTGYIPGLEDGSVQINNNIVPSISSDQREYKYSINKLEVCTYSCKTGYALSGNVCLKVCDEPNKRCNLGQYTNLNRPTFTNNYEYGCFYDELLYKCEVNCDVNEIWNGNECVGKENVCGSEKYTCLLGSVSNTGMNLENFIWDCVDENENVIGDSPSCSKRKEIVNRVVYYSNTRGEDRKQNVYFYMTGNDIPVNIKIKQNYSGSDVGYETIYTIPANQKNSNKAVFSQGIGLKYPEWYASIDYVIKEDKKLYVPVSDKLYVLKIEEYNGLCTNSCSTAGQCLRGATSTLSRSGMNGDKAIFQWRCSLGTISEICATECEVDAGKCGNVIVGNSKSCDPSNDIDCNIKGQSVISLVDFYMDKEVEKIVGSKCGEKRHCLYRNGYVSCTESIENCVQQGFKCKDGYVLSGCNCISITGNICITTVDPGKCVTGMVATGYSKGEGKNNYSYYCEKDGMQKILCEANCDSGKIWNGTGCIAVPELCGDKHNNCINQSSLLSNRTDDFAKKYKRTCKLGNNTSECSECYSGHIMSGSVCKVKQAVDCEATEYKGYKVPYLANGGEKQVAKNTRDSQCKLRVKCETGVIKSYDIETCLNVCNTGTNLGTCITGLLVNYPYAGNVGEYTYSYKCKDNSGYVFDVCNGRCPTGEYWNDYDRCGSIDRNLCGENRDDCINGGVLVNSTSVSSEFSGYIYYSYKWWCKLGNYQTGCVKNETVVHGCKVGTYGGYYVKTNLNHLQELPVTKTVSGVNCKATAVCGSGNISIVGEDCTNACPGGILDKPKCNFNGVTPLYSNFATWTSGYTYKCGDSECSANCSDNKIWNGYNCVDRISACNITGASCNQGIKNQVKSGEWGSTWNCKNVKNENLNETICYKCNGGYLWRSDKAECEEKSCGAMSKRGYSIPDLNGSTSVTVSKNISEGKCNATAICRKGDITLTGETCTCNDGYYLSGGVCNKICGNGYSTPCNGSYTATGLSWSIGGHTFSVWGTGYICNKNDNTVQGIESRQCSCGNKFRNGEQCQDSTHNVCGDEVNQCLEGVFIDGNDGEWGNIWKCKVQGQEAVRCYKCNDGYKWNENNVQCEKQNTNTTRQCGGTEPTIEHIIKGSSTYLISLNTGRKYVEDTPLNECEWTCDLGYKALWDRNGNVTDCVATPAPDPHGCTPSYQWVCRPDNTIHCISSCVGYCGETNDSYCISRLGDKPSDNLCIENNGQSYYRKCTDDGITQITGYCRKRNMDGGACYPPCDTYHTQNTCEISPIDDYGFPCCKWVY